MTRARFDPDAPAQPHSAQAARYEQVRAATLALAAPLSADDCQAQSMPDASPVKWHLAHVTWFFETFVLERFEPDFRPFDPAFRVLFNSYYQGVGERHPRAQRGLITRPTLEEVIRYRAQVDARMVALIDGHAGDASLATLVTLGLHHEQQHQELLLTDVQHLLSFNPTHAPYAKRWPIGAVSPGPLRWHRYDGGLFALGHDPALDGDFCFDNETPRHTAHLAPFELASRPVSYGEYLAFIDDGGYRQPQWWLAMGWDWVQAHARQAPLYWQRDGSCWLNHTLQGCVEIDPHTPVCHLSFFEAEAYARWAGARLPTEAEWEF
ncbi:MAG TPA: ergothioneine biosynthesis protein EgtB, partial [Albitalea sp.]|nr:ergothioneine biosynthesis protein EgtB [Albitalea sp.]